MWDEFWYYIGSKLTEGVQALGWPGEFSHLAVLLFGAWLTAKQYNTFSMALWIRVYGTTTMGRIVAVKIGEGDDSSIATIAFEDKSGRMYRFTDSGSYYSYELLDHVEVDYIPGHPEFSARRRSLFSFLGNAALMGAIGLFCIGYGLSPFFTAFG